jgi:hypothetical protein
MAAWFDMYCQLFGYGSCRSVPMSDMATVFGPLGLGFGALAMATYVMLVGPRASR